MKHFIWVVRLYGQELTGRLASRRKMLLYTDAQDLLSPFKDAFK
ncbi:hypothetical protein [Brevibacillus brevis]|nr:hypothetical protein [Brevibacillus brevis]